MFQGCVNTFLLCQCLGLVLKLHYTHSNTITIGDHVILQPIYKMKKDTLCLFDLYRPASSFYKPTLTCFPPFTNLPPNESPVLTIVLGYLCFKELPTYCQITLSLTNLKSKSAVFWHFDILGWTTSSIAHICCQFLALVHPPCNPCCITQLYLEHIMWL
jgi:hypothetical protein